MAVTDTPARPRGRPRDVACGAAIIQAALELIAERGYDGATVDAIAARAGVSKPTIYRRWPSGKDELVAAAIRDRRDQLSPLVDTGSLRGDLLDVVGQMIAGIQQNAHLAVGMAQRLRESPELAGLFRIHVVAPERQRFATIVERAVGRGELSPAPHAASLTADIASAAVYFRRMITGEPLDAGFAEQLVEHVLLPALRSGPETEAA